MRQEFIVTALLAVVGLPTAFFADGGWEGVRRDIGHVAEFRPFAPPPARGSARPDRGVGAAAAKDAVVEGTLTTAMTLARGAAGAVYSSHPGSGLVTPNDPRFTRPPAAANTGDITGDIRAGQSAQQVLRSAEASARSVQVKVASLVDPTDYGSALKRYALAVDPGNADLRYAIALDYLDPVAPDYATAARWLLSAAELGSGRAALDLSGLYLEGHGVERNYPEAYLWATVAKRSLTIPADQTMAVDRAARLSRAMTPAERAQAEIMVSTWKPVAVSGPDDPAAVDLLDPFDDG